MAEWKKTFCALCYHNCGLEIQTEGHRIVKVRPDKEHPRTRGYICRKGTKIGFYQDHKERLTHPLKRDNDRFVEISWDQAVAEIAQKLGEIIQNHGPRALAYMGGGGQGSHMETGFGRTLLTSLGSQYHYSPLAQELTGLFWVNGRAYGRQHLHLGPDLDRAKNFLVIGWNGYVSNAGVNRARSRINAFAKDPDKQLMVVDPLWSETAKRADKHLQIRIGTAALFLKTMIAIILKEGWEDRSYIEEYTLGFDKIANWFKAFDVASAVQVCGIPVDAVREVARIYASEPTAMRTDLGLLMDRQSTLNSYLEMMLMAVCGRIGTPGGNVFQGYLMPMGPHSDEWDPKTWRTLETDIPAIMGYFPPNVLPEEIQSQKEDHLRAMIVSGSNPLRSYADTIAYNQAFKELDLLVTIEIAMTETARMSHYVLPAKSAFEKWDATFFSLTFPEVYFQLRHPSCESLGEPLEEGEIYLRLAKELGLLPDIPASLYQAAGGDRKTFAMELLKFTGQDRAAAKMLPFVVAETLGKPLNSAHLASVWGLMIMYPPHAVDALTRAGYDVAPFLGDDLFQDLLDHPEGILIGIVDPDRNLESLRTPDKKIHLYIEELAEWMDEISPESEKAALKNEAFPLVLVAGRHFPYTANSIMRNPAWNDYAQACTLLMNEKDVRALEIADGESAWIITETSRVKIGVEVSDIPAQGTVMIPHGFGMVYDSEAYGVNVNELTRNVHRDRLAATPLHRYVPCRVEAA
ncbi:MAG: molybdopterin-dependent oxidoreductase [Deltaproteobacteria bacterium]|nr:molybdopterin-dependent oxidoreductase [Deltaproteobacteria bacterium]